MLVFLIGLQLQRQLQDVKFSLLLRLDTISVKEILKQDNTRICCCFVLSSFWTGSTYKSYSFL